MKLLSKEVTLLFSTMQFQIDRYLCMQRFLKAYTQWYLIGEFFHVLTRNVSDSRLLLLTSQEQKCAANGLVQCLFHALPVYQPLT